MEIIFFYIWLTTGTVHEIKTTLTCDEAEHRFITETEEKNILYNDTPVLLYMCSKNKSEWFNDKRT
jgi:hypothetical protein